MARRYAEDTRVPVERSQQELRKLLTRFEADKIMTYWDDQQTVIVFRARGRMIKMHLPLDNPTPQEERAAWRQLLLILKAKITAIDAGITTFEREFLADTMLPDGSTVGQWSETSIPQAWRDKEMPALLPGT